MTLANQIIKPTFEDQSDQNAIDKQIGMMTAMMLAAGLGETSLKCQKFGYIMDL